jgi:CheY-like chemotaxis protein
METSISPININEQIEEVYNFFKPEVEEKGLRIFLKNALAAKESIVRTDKEKIDVVLTHLVKNAIKFSDKGVIELGCYLNKKEPDELEFYIKDNGVGISKERLTTLFDQFVPADISDKKAFHGAGLGLSVSRAYVEMLGGKIWAESELGQGSTFYFTIPYSRKPEVREGVTDDSAGNKAENLSILIAEDDEISGMLIALAVKSLGKDIFRSSNGTETVEICRKNPNLDFVLMDIKMPGIDGYEATRQIRYFNNKVVIIAQTAYALSGDREKALEAGCNDYIAKPFGLSSLTALMKKHLQVVH